MKRRELLKSMCAAGGCALVGGGASPRTARAETAPEEGYGILIDTTRCLGCRMCEGACARANGLPDPQVGVSHDEPRSTTPAQWTVVNRHRTEAGPVTVKRQCMHCLQPACVSACLTRAMHRTPAGAVAWDVDKCMGCRFCMVSCPFDVPKFEYDSPVPKIQKCQMCWERLESGERPACVAACPAGAIAFGTRSAMLLEGRRRIALAPDRYVPRIYGEHEAGGTRVLYLASVPFEQLGFRTDLGDEPYPSYTREFLYAVPVVLTLVPPFLLAVSRAKREQEIAASQESRGEER